MLSVAESTKLDFFAKHSETRINRNNSSFKININLKLSNKFNVYFVEFGFIKRL